MSQNLTGNVVEVASHALFGCLRRDEYPDYYAGISENEGTIWTSAKSHAAILSAESLPSTVATIQKSPWLRSIKGLRWEISLPNNQNQPSRIP